MRSLRKSRGHRSQTRVKLEGYVCVARGDEVAEWQASHYCWQRTMDDTSKAASNAASASGKFSSLSKCLTSMPAKSLGVFLNSGRVRFCDYQCFYCDYQCFYCDYQYRYPLRVSSLRDKRVQTTTTFDCPFRLPNSDMRAAPVSH